MKNIPTLFFSLIVSFILLPLIAISGNSSLKGKNDSTLKSEVGQWMKNTNDIRFLENKGQMADMQGKALSNLLFKASAGGVDIYITTSGISYVFKHIEVHEKAKKLGLEVELHEDNDSITGQYCRADMDLVGADIRKENIIKEGESKDRTDYYIGGVCPNGVLNVRNYEKVTVKNIYPGIDWVLHTGTKGLKYDFVVQPGANPSAIRLKYKWTDKPELQNDGSLRIAIPMGNITEGIPLSYCGDQEDKINTKYTMQNNEIKFTVSNYNTNKILVIDPKLVWATYYPGTGSNGFEEVYSMQEDGTNVWVTGWAQSINFPTLNSGGGTYFQDTNAGSMNVFIAQFDTAGVLKWATYYGGNTQDMGNSIYSDGTNVWVTGQTNSTNFPTLNPGGGTYFQGTAGGIGARNAFILQFSITGILKWATYYGGSSTDEGNSIQSDGTNVWVTGQTSSLNFPTLNPGGGTYFQGVDGGGGFNLFILKFTTSGVCKWATYYGGSGNGDIGNSIYSDGTNVWVTGQTNSINFPTLNPGSGAYYQGTLTSTHGNAFILQFNILGVCEWATYYGGNGNGDMGNSIYSDGTNVWLTGQTYSTNFPTLNPGGGAYFQGSIAGPGYNAFILQFNSTGICKWATYYGGNSGDVGYSIQNDGVSIWVCGATSSTNFPTFNPGCGTFYQDTLGNTGSNTQDVFILQFTPAGILKWATYYGVDAENDGSFAWSDRKNLFIAGDAEYNGYPTLNPSGGSYYYTNVDGHEDVFIGKFCISCSSPLNLTVVSPDTICAGSSITLAASGANSYFWSPSTGLSSTNISNPVANPSITTTYTVIGTSSGCSDTDNITVNVNPVPNVTTCCSITINEGQTAILNINPVMTGNIYYWTPSTELSCTNCPNPIASPTISTKYFVTITDSNGCSKTDTVSVEVLCGNLFIPDAFSPNNGQNERLYVRDDCIKTMTFMVFDRWGNKVFETNNLSDGWDGTFKGEPMNTGTYVYYLTATMYDGTTTERKGNVALVR
ncbi:MAG: gliding motility-associated C-terminal domain-containing protein [Bacteroidia bacterium]